MVLYGALIATLAPYVSTLAVAEFGLGDHGYAAVLVCAALVSVTASVAFGIRSDQRANRRAIATASMALMVAGLALVLAGRAPWAFVATHALLLPLSSTIFGQLFAFARLAASTHPDEARGAILSALRALFAVPFVLVLPVWSVAFSAGIKIMAVYPVCLLLAGIMLAISLRAWPRDGATAWTDTPSGLSFAASLRELGSGRVLVRVLALGAVNGGVILYLVLIGLVFAATEGRGAADVALFVGFVAGLEVPFMLALPLVAARAPKGGLIVIGALLYSSHLALLPVLAHGPFVWLLIVPAAVGGALILTLPIAYLQDLMADRPGAGASLIALQRLAGEGTCAAAFAIGTALSGYGLAAALGAGVAASGAIALWLMDRRTGF